MLISFATRFATLSSIFRSRAALELENLALRQQIGVLQRSARKRLGLTPIDRLLWVWLSRGAAGSPRWPSFNPRRSLPGIVLASAFSGLRKSSVADRDDPSFLARFAI
jgi:hypothetical protein